MYQIQLVFAICVSTVEKYIFDYQKNSLDNPYFSLQVNMHH